ncbi:helix-turn-helix domain-containing protein [Mucilaginibacter sp.]|jgi:AraC-like DNA-binding protein|uniref:helix-turn-helix domain-containing protein n=1 Tax=Mucilaginibacter sp. TaxID=1882438 RepID=UPI003567FBF3
MNHEVGGSFSIFRLNDNGVSLNENTRLPCNKVMVINKGQGTLQVDEQLFEISGKQVFLMAKGQIYRFSNEVITDGFELSFDDFFWEKAPASASNCKSVLFDNAAVNQVLPLSKSDYNEIVPLFELLFQEYQKAPYINKADALAAYLKIIMIKMANVNAALKEGFDNYEYLQYRKFYDLISKEFMVSHEVDYYASILYTTARKLTALCKRYSGIGAKELINRQIMSEAKRSLQFSSNPVKEIAYQLRFSTPEQFSHFFKKNAAESPQHYRSKIVNIGM